MTINDLRGSDRSAKNDVIVTSCSGISYRKFITIHIKNALRVICMILVHPHAKFDMLIF